VPSPAAAAFGEGWTAVRAGRFVDAAEAFGRAAALAGPEPLAEDAAFWRAVALGRAGWSAAAGQALLGFLERHPRSPRAGEAAVMLGWILLEAGDVAGAAARFRAAVDDPVPAVRNGAREGLRTAEDAGGE
jgi:TolA-binding protein